MEVNDIDCKNVRPSFRRAVENRLYIIESTLYSDKKDELRLDLIKRLEKICSRSTFRAFENAALNLFISDFPDYDETFYLERRKVERSLENEPTYDYAAQVVKLLKTPVAA